MYEGAHDILDLKKYRYHMISYFREGDTKMNFMNTVCVNITDFLMF